MQNVQSLNVIQANADLLRRVAAAIGLDGETLIETCERVIFDVQIEAASVEWREKLTAAVDEAARFDPSSDTTGDG